jgi:hypothetical protein
MIKPKYDPRLDRLARRLDLDKEWPEGWSYRAREADSFGPGHLVIWWKPADMTAQPTEIDIKRTARGTRIRCEDASGRKRIDFLPEPFDSIIARLEQRALGSGVAMTFGEFTSFLGLQEEESCKTTTK